MTIAEDLVADFGREAAKTRGVLAACPEGHFGYKPHAKSMTLGALAGHVAENPLWVESMMEDSMDVAAMDGYAPFAPTTADEAVAAFDVNVAKFVAALEGRADVFFAETWTMKAGDAVMMSAVRGEVVRDIGVHHMIHHRAQLTVYLRLLDAPVPSTYGPTADFPDAPAG